VFTGLGRTGAKHFFCGTAVTCPALSRHGLTVVRRLRAMQGFRSFHSAWRTIQGIETVNMIRKGQIRWLAKNDIAGQVAFISSLFSLALAA
jgi:DDE domain